MLNWHRKPELDLIPMPILKDKFETWHRESENSEITMPEASDYIEI